MCHINVNFGFLHKTVNFCEKYIFYICLMLEYFKGKSYFKFTFQTVLSPSNFFRGQIPSIDQRMVANLRPRFLHAVIT